MVTAISSFFSLISAVPKVMIGEAVLATGVVTGLSKLGWNHIRTNHSLTKGTEDMIEAAIQGKLRGRTYGRKKLLTNLKCSLVTNRGLILITGQTGTGKTALLEEIAYQIKEGKIPGLKNATLRRLYKETVSPKRGIWAQGEEIFLGSSDNELIKIFNELMTNNGKGSENKTIILFIDEFYNVFKNKLNILEQFLPELDTDGLIIIGATSDQYIARELRAWNRESDFPLNRRMTEIPVQEMTREEVTETLQEGRKDLEDIHRIELRDDGIKAIVHFADQCPCLPHSKFPDKAFKFLRRIVAQIRNAPEQFQLNENRDPILDANAVYTFLTEITTPQVSTDTWKKQFEDYNTSLQNQMSDEKEAKTLFDEHFKQIAPPKSIRSSEILTNLSKKLDDALNIQEKQTCFVKINSHIFLEMAIKNFIKDETSIFYFPVQKMFALTKKNGQVLSLFKEKLSQMDKNSILILDDTFSLLKVLSSGINHVLPEPSQMIPDAPLDTLIKGGERLFNMGLEALKPKQGTDQIDRSQGFVSRHLESSLNNEPFFLELIPWIISLKGNRSIITVQPGVEAELSALRSLDWPVLEIKHASSDHWLRPIDVIDWLKAELIADCSWIETLVFLIYGLSDNNEIGPADLCHKVFTNIRTHSSDEAQLYDSLTDTQICNAINQETHDAISCRDAEVFLQAIKKLENTPQLPPSLSSLTSMIPQLAMRALQQTNPLLLIEETDPVKAELFTILIANCADKAKRRIIKLSELNHVFPSQPLLLAYCKNLIAKFQGLIIATQQELIDHKPLLKSLHEMGFAILCQSTMQMVESQKSKENPSNNILDRCSHLVKTFLNITENKTDIPATPLAPPKWEDSFVRIKLPVLTQDQFKIFFTDLILFSSQNSKPTDEIQNACLSAYFYLYQLKESPWSLKEISESMTYDLAQEFSSPQEFVEQLYACCNEKQCWVSKNDLLFSINPSLTTCSYRIGMKIKNCVAAFFRYLSMPFTALSSTFIGKTIVAAKGWVAGSVIVLIARHFLFGF